MRIRSQILESHRCRYFTTELVSAVTLLYPQLFTMFKLKISPCLLTRCFISVVLSYGGLHNKSEISGPPVQHVGSHTVKLLQWTHGASANQPVSEWMFEKWNETGLQTIWHQRDNWRTRCQVWTATCFWCHGFWLVLVVLKALLRHAVHSNQLSTPRWNRFTLLSLMPPPMGYSWI